MSVMRRDERLAVLTRVAELELAGSTLREACRACGASAKTVKAWRRRYLARGAEGLKAKRRPGRPALREWPAEDVQAIRELYLRTNAAEGKGSMSMAVRIALSKGLLSEGTARALSREMGSKHYIPTSLRRELEIAPAVFRHHRHPRNATLGGAYVPGGTRLASGGERRLRWGERYSFDDGSQNQVVCVPWPWGGTREADRYGIRTCRGQWLVAHDDATSHIDAWVFTLRPRDSYRDPDALSLCWRLMRDVVKPDQVVCEGGVWQSKRALAFHRAAGVEVLNAKGRPHLKLIENWFNRAWTFLSHYPGGQIGRFRGEYERENTLLMRCRSGAVDGRKHFPMLPELLREFDECVEFLNQDRIESDTYGRWVPAERKALDMEQCPRGAIGEDLSLFASPESHKVKVRRGGMVVCRTVSPLGESCPYEFADEALMRLEGQWVRVLFDPYDRPARAAVLAEGRSRDYAPGGVVCEALCMNPPPAADAAWDWEVLKDTVAPRDALRVKKAIAGAVRTEYRALGSGGRRGETEVRGPDGVTQVASGGGAGTAAIGTDGAMVGGTGTEAAALAAMGGERVARPRRRSDATVDEVEALEREASEGLLVRW